VVRIARNLRHEGDCVSVKGLAVPVVGSVVVLSSCSAQLCFASRLHGRRSLESRALWGDEDTGEAGWAVAQLVENRGADQSPEPVSRDLAEQFT
jgi:hypothetical protein